MAVIIEKPRKVSVRRNKRSNSGGDYDPTKCCVICGNSNVFQLGIVVLKNGIHNAICKDYMLCVNLLRF